MSRDRPSTDAGNRIDGPVRIHQVHDFMNPTADRCCVEWPQFSRAAQVLLRGVLLERRRSSAKNGGARITVCFNRSNGNTSKSRPGQSRPPTCLSVALQNSGAMMVESIVRTRALPSPNPVAALNPCRALREQCGNDRSAREARRRTLRADLCSPRRPPHSRRGLLTKHRFPSAGAGRDN